MEKSPYLYNFFKGRGAPTAIEIIEDEGPTRVLLYYPKEKEVYAADPMIVGKDIRDREWIVRGPYQIERKDYKDLMRMDMAMNGIPVFEIGGHQVRFGKVGEEKTTRVLSPLPPPMPTPKPTPKKKKVVYQSTPETGAIKEVDQKNWRPLNSDQQAINMAKGFAERAANGDLIHTSKAGDNLALIAKWYTDSANNAAAIAQANAIAPTETLGDGKRLTIPLKLVKQFKAMPADYK